MADSLLRNIPIYCRHTEVASACCCFIPDFRIIFSPNQGTHVFLDAYKFSCSSHYSIGSYYSFNMPLRHLSQDEWTAIRKRLDYSIILKFYPLLVLLLPIIS